MKKLRIIGGALVASLVLLLGSASFAVSTSQLAVDIEVAPRTLLLQSTQGGEVTVHAEIAYSAVDHASVALNGIDVAWTKSDSRGELVAKFDEDAVKAMVAPPGATLELTGYTTGGDYFAGSAVVAVRD